MTATQEASRHMQVLSKPLLTLCPASPPPIPFTKACHVAKAPEQCCEEVHSPSGRGDGGHLPNKGTVFQDLQDMSQSCPRLHTAIALTLV